MDDKSPRHTSLGKKGIKLACVTEVQEDLKYSGLYLELLKVSRESSAWPFSSAPCVCLMHSSCHTRGLTSVDSAAAVGRQPLLSAKVPELVSLSDLVTYILGTSHHSWGWNVLIGLAGAAAPPLLSITTGNRCSETEEAGSPKGTEIHPPKEWPKHAPATASTPQN